MWKTQLKNSKKHQNIHDLLTDIHLIFQRKEAQEMYAELDEEAQSLLSENAVAREQLGAEISEMRQKSVRDVFQHASDVITCCFDVVTFHNNVSLFC